MYLSMDNMHLKDPFVPGGGGGGPALRISRKKGSFFKGELKAHIHICLYESNTLQE